MKRIGLLIAFLAMLFIVLPSLTAQDEKKKDPDKKDEAKKTDEPKKKEEPDKKKEKDEPKKEKLEYSSMWSGKIISVNGRDLTVEKKELDPKKYQDAVMWQAQRMQQINQAFAQATQQYQQGMASKDIKARVAAQQNYAKAQLNYQNDVAKMTMEMAKKDVSTAKPYDVRGHDDAKVRAMTPPVEFDDLGFEKKWTKKELEELRDKTGLVGFPTDFDQLKSGQYVDIYMAKAAPKEKDQPKKKKADDDPPEVKARPEAIMIVIRQQPAPPK